MHKLRAFADPTNSFIIQKMLLSCHRQQPSTDHRLPIDKAMLGKLLGALEHTCRTKREHYLYQAMFTLAFHAFLRIGEMTVGSISVVNPNRIHVQQLAVSERSMAVKFASYKHSKGQPFNLTIQAGMPGECPVEVMRKYLAIRGTIAGPLFTMTSESPIPVTRAQFNTQLRLCLAFCRYPTTQFTSHSFRIGAATTAAAQGLTDAQIRQLGRWNSDAFKKYIRNGDRCSAL